MAGPVGLRSKPRLFLTVDHHLNSGCGDQCVHRLLEADFGLEHMTTDQSTMLPQGVLDVREVPRVEHHLQATASDEMNEERLLMASSGTGALCGGQWTVSGCPHSTTEPTGPNR